ncbi:MAG: threonine/homoserine/homoserine lactone efflux protein [Crocinitomicaceae bacterium]|jgi:threonine/homoserine/homoserine lactone efflux protein
MALLTGILLGLSTLAFIGPVLFYLLKSSLESGVKAGISVSAGILVGDAIYIVLALYGARYFFEDPAYQKWVALSGGLILLIIGIKYVAKPVLETNITGKIKRKSLGVYFLNGFLINFVNPFVFAVWLGFVSINQSIYSDRWTVISLITTLLIIFSTDVLKAIFAAKLIKIIRPGLLKKVFRVFGVLMIIFAARLIWAYLSLSEFL